MDRTDTCNYSTLDEILINNGFKLHVCIWYNAVYIKESRLKKNTIKIIFDDEWWNGMIQMDANIQVAKKYNKK